MKSSEFTSMTQEPRKIDEEEYEIIAGFDMFETKYDE